MLRAIRNVPWPYGETTADYVLSETTCALVLSIRYHLLHPNSVTRRLLELTLGYTLRIVLVLVDCDDPDEPGVVDVEIDPAKMPALDRMAAQ